MIVLLILAVLLAAVFLAGRWGWKLFGFRACQGAGVSTVEVSENAVHITGFWGFRPQPALVYSVKQENSGGYEYGTCI